MAKNSYHLRAGRLRHIVTFQRPSGSRDAVGGRVTNFEAVSTENAEIVPMSATERLMAAQMQASSTHTIIARYSPTLASLTANCRVVYGSRIFVLDGPPLNVEERNRLLEMTCVEGLRPE